MERHDAAQRWWLLTARGALYILIGAVMFVFANTYSALTGHIIGVLAILAGLCGLGFAFTNQRAEKNNIWGILHGLTDVAFGIAIWVYSEGTIKGLVDVLGFWAMMYAFLQAVQAMYVMFSAKSAGGMNYPGKVIHFLNVLVAGGFAFMLLLRPQGFSDSLGLAGFFPIALGVLIIVLTQQLRAQSVERAR